MENFLHVKKITIFLIFIFSLTLNSEAQLRLPTGQTANQTHLDPGTNLILGGTTNLHNDANAYHLFTIHGGITTYGNRSAIRTRTQTIGSTGTSAGVSRVILGQASDWNANGRMAGVRGDVDSLTLLRNTNSSAISTSLGGRFISRIFDPIPAGDTGTGTYYIVGSHNILAGNITNYPTQGVVAAMFADDQIDGPGTWAGYFDGRGYFNDNVGIKTLNPLSSLSVNGDGDNRTSIYSHTNSTTSGNIAVHGDAALPIGFADHVRAVMGTIESGTGYTYGVVGSAISNNPSANGRAYGVYGQASNATDGTNFGVYARLLGSNGGTALLAHDDIGHPGAFNGIMSTGAQTWAGFLVGDVHMSNRVAIGTAAFNTPALPPSSANNYKLFVCGGIIGQELFINNSAWCDYVFEADYELTSLEEVEEHINEKGHLHNTPSAQQIEDQDGFEMGEMTRNQQEKIEEIYLHLIDLNKQVKSLKEENAALRNALETSNK